LKRRQRIGDERQIERKVKNGGLVQERVLIPFRHEKLGRSEVGIDFIFIEKTRGKDEAKVYVDLGFMLYIVPLNRNYIQNKISYFPLFRQGYSVPLHSSY